MKIISFNLWWPVGISRKNTSNQKCFCRIDATSNDCAFSPKISSNSSWVDKHRRQLSFSLNSIVLICKNIDNFVFSFQFSFKTALCQLLNVFFLLTFQRYCHFTFHFSKKSLNEVVEYYNACFHLPHKFETCNLNKNKA